MSFSATLRFLLVLSNSISFIFIFSFTVFQSQHLSIQIMGYKILRMKFTSNSIFFVFLSGFEIFHSRHLSIQIMGYKIFTHEIHSSYAARMDNFRSYDTISKDIIQRWTYPLVPDIMFCGHSATKLERQGMYRGSGKKELLYIISYV